MIKEKGIADFLDFESEEKDLPELRINFKCSSFFLS